MRKVMCEFCFESKQPLFCFLVRGMLQRKTIDLSIPRKMKRLLLFVVPSILVLGLVGLAGWRWWRKRGRQMRRLVSAGSQVDHTELLMGQRSPAGSDDSGVVATGPNSQTGESRKCSEENITVNPASNPPLLLPKTDSEKPIHSWRYPKASSDIQSELFSDVDSFCSGDPVLDKHSHLDLSGITGSKSKEISASHSISTLVTDSMHQASESTQKSLSTPVVVGDKWSDRKRVMVQLPRDLVGRFIGKQGRNIKSLMSEADGAHVYVNQKNLSKDALIVPCTVQGTAGQVEQALQIIACRYPELDLPSQLDKDWFFQLPLPSPLFGTPRLNGETWDMVLSVACVPSTPFSALVSYIESLSRLWIVPYERSRELDEQHQSMSYTYCYATATGNDSLQAGEGDEGLFEKFCAVRVSDIHWLRGQIAKFSDDGSNYEVLLIDYGSTVIVPTSALRPLRREYSSLPIQAFPCELANVIPNDAMSEEGLMCLQGLVEGVALEVHITGNTTGPILSTSASKTTSPLAKDCGLSPSTNQTTPPLAEGHGSFANQTTPPLAEGPDQTTHPLAEDHESSISTGTKDVIKGSFHLPPTPLVELYTEFGEQSPLFVNHELVEQGFATWREDTQPD